MGVPISKLSLWGCFWAFRKFHDREVLKQAHLFFTGLCSHDSWNSGYNQLGKKLQKLS